MAKPNGYVLWEGPSVIDGEPIAVIATGFAEKSANSKTGAMVQIWILAQNAHPAEVFASAHTVCGDCPHRLNRTCYVNWVFGPGGVWKAYRKGSYPPIGDNWAVFDNASVRIGAAGDPCAAPKEAFIEVILRARTHTGYTHQWRHPRGQWAKGLLQASCDNFADFLEADAQGWKTFYVLPKGAVVPNFTVHCAASEERGHKTTCAQCKLCDGATTHVAIHAHGKRHKHVVG